VSCMLLHTLYTLSLSLSLSLTNHQIALVHGFPSVLAVNGLYELEVLILHGIVSSFFV